MFWQFWRILNLIQMRTSREFYKLEFLFLINSIQDSGENIPENKTWNSGTCIFSTFLDFWTRLTWECENIKWVLGTCIFRFHKFHIIQMSIHLRISSESHKLVFLILINSIHDSDENTPENLTYCLGICVFLLL